MTLASRCTSSSGIMHVSNSLTGGTGSGSINGGLGMWWLLAMWMDILAFVHDSLYHTGAGGQDRLNKWRGHYKITHTWCRGTGQTAVPSAPSTLYIPPLLLWLTTVHRPGLYSCLRTDFPMCNAQGGGPRPPDPSKQSARADPGWGSRLQHIVTPICSWLIVTRWTLTRTDSFVYDSAWLLLTHSDSYPYYRCVLGSLSVEDSIYPE